MLGVGALVFFSGLVLARTHSRIAALTMLLGGVVAAVAGIWALTSPYDVYVQVGSRQVGQDPDAISLILDQFRTDVTAGVGAWVATIAGGLAAALGIVFLVAPRRPRETAGFDGVPGEVIGTEQATPTASDPDTPNARSDFADTTLDRAEGLEPDPSVAEERSESESRDTSQPTTSVDPLADVGPNRPESDDRETAVGPWGRPSVDQEAPRRPPDVEDWR